MKVGVHVGEKTVTEDVVVGTLRLQERIEHLAGLLRCVRGIAERALAEHESTGAGFADAERSLREVMAVVMGEDLGDPPGELAEHGEVRESLAAAAHEAWSGWMRYMFGKAQRVDGSPWQDEGYAVLPAESVSRWVRQMNTPYAELPEAEKASDRTEADRYLAAFISGLLMQRKVSA